MTIGTSLIPAQPIASVINENPGPDVQVADLVPVSAPPIIIPIAEISSSVCITAIEPGLSPSTSRIWFCSRKTLSSDAGVIG